MAETDRPNLFENLPTDILLLVLDNIHLYSDLLALCLTSKACNSLATQRLYKNIVLDTCNWNDELPLICKCLDAGASKHLRYTQSLSLLDVPDFVMNMDLGWPRSRQIGRKDWITLRILRSFPQNQLATFRHISGLELGPSVMSLLESQQKSLVNVHVTRGDFQKLISPSSKRLTVGIFQHHQATDGLVELTQSLPELESLSLIFKTGVDRMASNWWGENGYEEHLPEKRIVTRELTLDGIIPEKLVHNIPYLFDLSRLTRLSLYEYDVNSWMWKDHLARSPDLKNLTHFGLHSRDSRHTFDRDWEFFEGLFREEESDLLRDMFARNKNLQHVSLHIFALAAMSLEPLMIDDENQSSAGSDVTPYLWPLRHSLKTLSLLDMMSTIKRSVQFPSKSELDAVCSEFGALEQFGIRVPEQDGFYYTDAAEIHTHVLGHLEPIKKLKDLRILHLYQDRIRLSHAEPHARDPWEQTLKFATQFFQWAHTSCPHLNVLVWGRFTETIDDEIFDMFDVDPDRGPALLEFKQVERVGQQCFIKQFAQDENRATRITALRVSRKQLRNDYPDLDILSCDTSIDVKDRLSREVLY